MKKKEEKCNDISSNVTLPITICAVNGKRVILDVSVKDTTLSQFKKLIKEEFKVPPSRQRLIFCGRELQTDSTLSEIGVGENGFCFVHMAEKPPKSKISSKPKGKGKAVAEIDLVGTPVQRLLQEPINLATPSNDGDAIDSVETDDVQVVSTTNRRRRQAEPIDISQSSTKKRRNN